MLDKDYDYKAINTNRKSGVIMHISSLPSKYGIGTFGKKACELLIQKIENRLMKKNYAIIEANILWEE